MTQLMKFIIILIILGIEIGINPLLAQAKKEAPYIPVEKNLDNQWVKSLYDKGETKVYEGKELVHIAMPCGGIGAGQVEVTGEGKLCFTESVYNLQQSANMGNGYSTGFQYLNPLKPESKIENEFAIHIEETGKAPQTLSLSSDDFDAIQFIGKYPIAQIKYGKSDAKLPVKISSEVFSPFVPLSVRNSANPVTILKYSVTNTSSEKVRVSLLGRLKNIDFPESLMVKQVNSVIKAKGMSGISFEMKPQSEDLLIQKHPLLGGLSLCVLDEKADCSVKDISFNSFLEGKKDNKMLTSNDAFGGVISTTVQLKPNETREITFLLSWYFPNYYETGRQFKKKRSSTKGLVGHIYNNWYSSSFDVAEYICDNYQDLYSQTKLFRDTYDDTTLPLWLANRITMPVSTLAAGNIAIWENGRMYAWEGIGFCTGTCSHVFNFVTAISKLFPELERSVRLMQDFNDKVAFANSGRINFRGYNGNDTQARHAYASDAQSGYVLKAYREHLMSLNNSFLDSIWDKVKLAMAYNIYKDGAEIGLVPNGVLEGKQTFWDPMWFGPNPYNNSLYLAALRAAEEMAKIKGEPALAQRYSNIFKQGQSYMDENMWKGEYYVHLYPNGFTGDVGSWNSYQKPEEIEKHAIGYVHAFNKGGSNYLIGGGCDANQLFGQNWAHQLGLGDILPPEKCKIAAKSIFKYCWTPDIATVYDYQKPKHRILGASGESAMVNAGWPKNNPQTYENTHDKSDVWTGLEYEAACDMINAGLLDEALISIRSIEDRYDGIKRNPWNEIEGSDHYVRAMHSWNVLLTLSGFTYNGPADKLGFSPKLTPENFKCFYSTTASWGNISQKLMGNIQEEHIEVKFGQLNLSELRFGVMNGINVKDVTVSLSGKEIASKSSMLNGEVLITFNSEEIINSGENLKVVIK